LIVRILNWLFIAFAPAILAAQSATLPRLERGKAIDRTLSAGATDTYALVLRAGDLVSVKVSDKGKDVILSVFSPAGTRERAFSSALQDGEPAVFLAKQAGSYRLAVAARDRAATAPYSITLRGIWDPPFVPTARDTDQSPRIARLKTPADVAAFWREIGPAGSPLIEGNLVTFLWRGADTHGVFVQFSPCVRADPGDCFMTHLAGTDLWYKSFRVDRRARTYYLLAPNPPRFTKRTADDTVVQGALDASYQRDPLNPRVIFGDPRNPDIPIRNGASILEMPDAPPQPWIQRRADVPAGTLDSSRVESALLKNTRTITVYTPPGYSTSATPYGLVLVFDGDTYIQVVPTPVILDNLIAAKRIPPVVAVMIGNVARATELPCNPTFADFLATELVPWLRQHYNVTTDPRSVTIGGSSYGGLAATYAAYRHPETFGNVLSQSGSYWWTPPKDSTNPGSFDRDRDPSYVANLFVESPKLPVRFYLDAGSMELDMSGRGGAILVPNRHLRDVLRAKGYDVFFQEFIGGHDYVSWRETLADGLIVLMGAAH
jgi:enterochelin esterase-like enzyme